MGRKYRTQTNLRTNLYVVGMAGSGGGKDHARGAIKEAFIAAGLQRYLGGNRLASGSGLLTALYRQPSSLFQLDEFGQFLGNIVNKRHAPTYLAEIWALMTELNPSAGGTFFGLAGMLLAIPALAAAMVFVRRANERYRATGFYRSGRVPEPDT